MLHSLHIAGYRSLLDLSLKLAPLTIVQGANGVGKSNIYKALKLFGSLASGHFPEAMAAESGTPGCFWAGPTPGPSRPKSVELRLDTADFRWDVSFGRVPTGPDDLTAFRSDPEIKKETLKIGSSKRDRKHWSREIPHNESMLSFIRDPTEFPDLAIAREQVLSWRFYEGFRTDASSPLRQPSPRIWSPVLASDGSNLPSVLQTILESSFPHRLTDILSEAFPDHELSITGEASVLSIEWNVPELSRPLTTPELSDGTLRFLAMAAALLGPKPPGFLVLNEPENSLNPGLFPALVRLIGYACEASQLLVITHSEEFAELLSADRKPMVHQLAMAAGATKRKQDLGSRRVWTFDD